ncbi:ATP-binding cassette domain-containing protein [Nocardioides sp. MAH-18]|uniref:ATP-binding cassette domain-containing protein n=1 Tax=Nocardioides agri TaxID=2682843 RepID=A0A6L6XWL7_9ACTN|nr:MULTISPECIES: ABC transporter ATP-binding protein [unclassified Nocardioides]MBA2952619.1 ABC transporter ATP-binding protein [Nocardioides sp. CGMCC 1.13656]MVQ51781.1 ATP-binding cassette domain-containing protein [Nocardioides sp. MAH-18]
MDSELAVDAVGVTKTFGSLCAVDDVTVKVEAGEVYGVLGPNGAGKTTFLRMLFGLVRPDSGTIRIFDRSWAADGVATLDGVAGFIESPAFYPYLTGRQNLEGLGLLDGGVRRDRVDEILELVDLTDRAGDAVGGYSYGMRQRLGVAASLIREPRLLVLDEPANGLDPAGIRDMRALVRRLAARGLTVLLSSHHMDEVEEICDNVTIMRQGGVAFHGAIAELRAMAPDPGYALSTTADDRALEIAAATPGIAAVHGPGTGLVVTGPAHEVSSYVSALVRAEVRLLAFTPTRTPLEQLFFMLTDTDPQEAEAA